MEKGTNCQAQQSPQEALLDAAPLLQTFLGAELSACQHQHHVKSCMCNELEVFGGCKGGWHDLRAWLLDQVRAAARCDEEHVDGSSQFPEACAVSACCEG